MVFLQPLYNEEDYAQKELKLRVSKKAQLARGSDRIGTPVFHTLLVVKS